MVWVRVEPEYRRMVWCGYVCNLNIDVWNGVGNCGTRIVTCGMVWVRVEPEYRRVEWCGYVWIPEYRRVEWCGYVWNLNIDVWNGAGTCGT
jgi:hypothetical protein